MLFRGTAMAAMFGVAMTVIVAVIVVVAMIVVVAVPVQLLVGFVDCDGGIGIQPAFHQHPNDPPLVSEYARAPMLEGLFKIAVEMLERFEHVGVGIDYL